MGVCVACMRREQSKGYGVLPELPVLEGAKAPPDGAKGLPAPHIEDCVKENSWVISRLRCDGDAQYVYARVLSLSPLRLVGADGQALSASDVAWIVSATDAGWLEPKGLEWQRPGQTVFLKLLEGDEWVAARVAQSETALVDPFVGDGSVYLPLEGVNDLPGVILQEEVGLLFTPLESCHEEFANVEPRRGGTLVDHLSTAFVPEQSRRLQKKRWIKEDHVNPQYPMRCVWMHPKTKEQALGEFVRRCHEKRRANGSALPAEVVMLLGPPAAGKSSIERLPPEEVAEDLRDTAATLKFREEINNDNLTDCMPDFDDEFCQALGMEAELDVSASPSVMSMGAAPSLPAQRSRRTLVKAGGFRGAARQSTAIRGTLMAGRERAESTVSAMTATNSCRSRADSIVSVGPKRIDWAMQWLVYTMYHHGPVRDSLAWDVIKVSIVDAEDIAVYYSSVMAGKAIERTMRIIHLGQSDDAPVPHKPLRFVGFWPYTSQEKREVRQKQRYAAEKREGKLKGGNIDVNLVNLHFHAQQAETNITRMLSSLSRGSSMTCRGSLASGESLKTAEEVSTQVHHFMIIDNDGDQPKVLLDWAHGEDSEQLAQQGKDMQDAARELLEWARSMQDWSSLCRTCYRIAQFFLPADDPTMLAVKEERGDIALERATELDELMPLLAEIDEFFFKRVNKQTSAVDTRKYRSAPSHVISKRGVKQLDSLPDEEVKVLKRQISLLRMFCCVLVMRQIREDGETVPERGSSSDSVSE